MKPTVIAFIFLTFLTFSCNSDLPERERTEAIRVNVRTGNYKDDNHWFRLRVYLTEENWQTNQPDHYFQYYEPGTQFNVEPLSNNIWIKATDTVLVNVGSPRGVYENEVQKYFIPVSHPDVVSILYRCIMSKK